MLGSVERRLHLRVPEELGPRRSLRANELRRLVGGSGFELARALSRLGLRTALAARIGNEPEDREIVDALRAESILTRGLERGDVPTPFSVHIETPSRSHVVESGPLPTRAAHVSAEHVARLVAGSRHVHAATEGLQWARPRDLREALSRAREEDASTSLDLVITPNPLGTNAKETLRRLGALDLLFAPAERLREATGERRLGRAVELLLERGVSRIVAELGAGGCRVYGGAGEPVRVPAFGDEEPRSRGAFVGAFLLGWLGGASPEVCGVLGAAARLPGRPPGEPGDRRELGNRLAHARTDPSLRRLVPAMVEAQRLLERLKRLPPRPRS